MSTRTKKRTAQVYSVQPNASDEPVYKCALWTPAGFAYAKIITSEQEIERAGGLRKLVASVLAADKVVIARGVR